MMASHQESKPRRHRRGHRSSTRRFGSQQARIAVFVAMTIVALAVIFARSGSRPGLGGVSGADASDASLVAAGQQIYATRCASCHGADLEGDPAWPERQPNGVMPASPLDERGVAWQHDDVWLFRTVAEGGQATAPPGYTSYMPAFGAGLSDEQIWAVLAYIKSTWPPETRAAQPTTQP
jgi:mono/diheme cytochrome c family protein